MVGDEGLKGAAYRAGDQRTVANTLRVVGASRVSDTAICQTVTTGTAPPARQVTRYCLRRWRSVGGTPGAWHAPVAPVTTGGLVSYQYLKPAGWREKRSGGTKTRSAAAPATPIRGHNMVIRRRQKALYIVAVRWVEPSQWRHLRGPSARPAAGCQGSSGPDVERARAGIDRG